MTLTIFIALILLGLVTGFYSGLIGTGGNVILIPVLDIVFSHYHVTGPESVKFIIANSLFITVFLGLAVSAKQYRMGNFYIKEILTIGIPGMISAFLLSEWIIASTWYEKHYFDLIFLSLLVFLTLRLLLIKSKENQEENTEKTIPGKLPLILLGLLTGSITSLSGLGGGVILIPFLTDALGVPIRKASSVSIGVVMLLALSVSISYLFVDTVHIEQVLPWQMGYTSMFIILPVLIGMAFSSSYGVKVAHRTSPFKLRVIFGIIMAILCIKLAYGLVVNL